VEDLERPSEHPDPLVRALQGEMNATMALTLRRLEMFMYRPMVSSSWRTWEERRRGVPPKRRELDGMRAWIPGGVEQMPMSARYYGIEPVIRESRLAGLRVRGEGALE